MIRLLIASGLLLGAVAPAGAAACEVPTSLSHLPALEGLGPLDLGREHCNRLVNTLYAADHVLARSESDSERANILGRLARRLYGYGCVESAREVFRAMSSLEPQHFRGSWILAVIEHETGGPNVTELVEAAWTLQPDHPPLQALLARLRFEGGELEAAYRLAAAAVESSPEHAYARWTLAELELERGDAEAALAHLAVAQAEAPEADSLHEVRARALGSLGRHDEAAAAARQAGGREPDLTGPWISSLHELSFEPLTDLGLGMAALRRKQYSLALEALERARESSPEDSETALQLGRCHRLMGNDDAAIESLRRATELESRFETWIELAQVLRTTGDFEGAVIALREALEHRPADKMAKFWLAECLVVQDSLGEALELVESLLEEGFGPPGYLLASDIELRRGRAPRAREFLKLGLERFPADSKLRHAELESHDPF